MSDDETTGQEQSDQPIAGDGPQTAPPVEAPPAEGADDSDQAEDSDQE